MSEFKPGWYQVGHRTSGIICKYFNTASSYTAEGLLLRSGLFNMRWHGQDGPHGSDTKPGDWSPQYRAMSLPLNGDWWEKWPGGEGFQPRSPGDFSRASRYPTMEEISKRLKATADSACASGSTCSTEIYVGIFFDGTNNNMDRDRKDSGHSNIVSLYDAHRKDKERHFAQYIPGVGTKFEEIGEMTESANGKSFAAGGEDRIHYALIQVFNSACRAVNGKPLVGDSEAAAMCKQLSTWWRGWSDDSDMRKAFESLHTRLWQALAYKRPRLVKLHLSVFGFSRGAAQARVFCNWIQKICPDGKVGGVPLNLHFLGIFDSVASVGLADSSLIGAGFMDWADGNMEISGVGETVHFAAAHEFRMSFPLSTARNGKRYPPNTKEYIYPGSHSDVGGGYSPKDQGKSVAGRSHMLAQIPLIDMYHAALKAGVKLMPKSELLGEHRPDFEIASELDRAFSAYEKWTVLKEREEVKQGSSQPTENRMRYHTHLYWRWRAQVSPTERFCALSSYRNGSEQARVDLWESELDWRADVERARKASQATTVYVRGTTPITRPPNASQIQRQVMAEVTAAGTVPPLVSEFFDKYVHDSHATFYLLGPVTAEERLEWVAKIKRKQEIHDNLKRSIAEARATAENTSLDSNTRMVAMRRIPYLEDAIRAYKLNQFERRVLGHQAVKPGEMPLTTDKDAADLRDISGIGTKAAVLFGMGEWGNVWGTVTRREPRGHARYRRVFDES